VQLVFVRKLVNFCNVLAMRLSGVLNGLLVLLPCVVHLFYVLGVLLHRCTLARNGLAKGVESLRKLAKNGYFASNASEHLHSGHFPLLYSSESLAIFQKGPEIRKLRP